MLEHSRVEPHNEPVNFLSPTGVEQLIELNQAIPSFSSEFEQMNLKM